MDDSLLVRVLKPAGRLVGGKLSGPNQLASKGFGVFRLTGRRKALVEGRDFPRGDHPVLRHLLNKLFQGHAHRIAPNAPPARDTRPNADYSNPLR
jgi:hypothetical protein